MLGTESIMTLNFAGQGFGVGFGEMNEMSPQHIHVGNGRGGSNGPAELGAGAAEEGKGFLKEDAMAGVGEQQQQLLPPTPRAPSSWASKVRAGLGSDCSPTLSGNAGVGGGGGVSGGLGASAGSGALGDLDPAIGDGIHGLSHGMGHLGSLTSSIGGGGSSSSTMGPVHGLDMERGMPGKALLATPSASAPGPAGVVQGLVGLGGVQGHQDPLQHRVGEGPGNGVQGVGIGVGGGGGQNGSSALAQDFGTLEIVGAGELGSRGTGTGEAPQGFDATKNELLGDFPCVRLRGLAADTSVKDILDFFVGLGPVLDIVLEGGATDGEVGAITLFGTLMDYHGALQRYSLQIKGRYIEVAPAVRSDYYSAVVKRSAESAAGVAEGMTGTTMTTAAPEGGEGNRDPQGQNGGLRRQDAASLTGSGKAPGPAAALRAAPLGTLSPLAAGAGAEAGQTDATGLPAQAAGAPEAPAPGARSPAIAGAQPSPAIAVTHAGGGGGAGAGAAVAATGGGGGGGARKGGAKANPLAAGSSKPKGSAGDAKGTVIRMRGLPYRASKSEVMGFFKGCSIPEDGIAFVTRADGRVTGEAYVRFATREDAKTGIRKDREMMGSRYIELFTSSPEEMARYANSKR